MGKIRLGRAGRFGYRAAQLAAAELLNNAERKLRDMFGHFYAHVRCYAERRHVRAHKPRYIHQNGGDGKQHGHPAVVRYMDGVFIVRRDLDDLPQDAPDVPKRHQRQQCAGGGKHPRKVGQDFVAPGILQQPG